MKKMILVEFRVVYELDGCTFDFVEAEDASNGLTLSLGASISKGVDSVAGWSDGDIIDIMMPRKRISRDRTRGVQIIRGRSSIQA